MQALTTAQLEHLKNGGLVGVNISITPTVGAPFAINDDDILEGSFSLDRSQWSTSQAVEIGNADAAELSFILDNSDGRWNSVQLEGATMELAFVFVGVGSIYPSPVLYPSDGLIIDDTSYLSGGKFIADRPVKGGQTVSVSALDYMVKFNKLYDGNLTYPATLLQILTDCATDCGVTLDATLSSFTNSSYSVTSAPIEAGLTYHQIVAWVAQLAGGNAWMDWDGELRISWYGDTNTVEGFDITADMLFQDADHGETEVQITGVEYVQEDTTYSAGTTGYVFRFKDNPLLQTGYQAVLDAISAKVTVQKFLPYQVLPTVFLPNLWPGDIVIADAVSFVPSDDGAEIAAIASGAELAAITNGAGIDGAGFAAKTYFKAGVLIGRHRMGTRSDMVGVGETATVLGYAPQTGLSDAMRNSVKAIATTKVETLAIERTLTVGASTVVVRIDDTDGISITKDGVQVFGVDTNGDVFASKIHAPTSPRNYGIIGNYPGIGSGLALYDLDLSSAPYFQLTATLDGNDNQVGVGVYDTNDVGKVFINLDGNIFITNVDNTKNIIEHNGTTGETLLRYGGATNHAIGVDATGPYKVVSGTKTYL